MITPDSTFNIFNTFDFWPIIKLFVLVLIFFYFVLSIVIVRQTELMNQVLGEEGVSPLLKLITIIHLLAVTSLFLLAFILI